MTALASFLLLGNPRKRPHEKICISNDRLFVLGVLSQFFHTLYDEAIITEKAFMIWISAEIPSTQVGKQSALQETAAFINWLLD